MKRRSLLVRLAALAAAPAAAAKMAPELVRSFDLAGGPDATVIETFSISERMLVLKPRGAFKGLLRHQDEVNELMDAQLRATIRNLGEWTDREYTK